MGRTDRHVPEHTTVHVPAEPAVPLELFNVVDRLKWVRMKRLELAAIARANGNGRARNAAVLAGDEEYGFLSIRPPLLQEKKVGFGIFQIKQNWSDQAGLDLIKLSAHKLA